MISYRKPITMFFFLLLCYNVVQAQVFFTDTSAFEVNSIEGGATWTKEAMGDFVYDNGGTTSSQRAIIYSATAFQSVDGFKLTIEYTTGSIGDDEGHNFSFGLISDDTDLSAFSGFNPFGADSTVYSIGANLTSDEDATARGLNFTNGTERVTFDESGTRAQFMEGETTKVTIEFGIGGYWSYRINDVYENSGVLLEGFDLTKSYRVAIYGQDDNGGGKSIQSIELKKRYAAGERAVGVRGTWNSDIYPTLIDERVTRLKTLDCFGVSFTNGAVLSAQHFAPHKLLESIEGSEEVVPAWGNLNFEYPENDQLMEHISIIRSAGFKVKAYTNSENFVGSNASQFDVFVKNWMIYCDTSKVVQAFINSQPYHTGIWNRTTQKYEDASATYPYRKYMFCYAEFVLKDYALRYGKYIDNWIFDDGSTMEQNGDNATSGIIEEQRIYQAFSNAVHAGNPEIPTAFNNGRSTVSYASYPYAHPVRFEDFTFGHAFGGNNDHASKEGGQFYSNYKYVQGMTATNGYVFTGNDWTWDDKIVGNFHSKLSTTAWKYGPVQAWEQADFNQWNLEAMQAGGSMTWGGSFNRTYTAVYDWVYVLLSGLDDYLAQYENPGAPNWARAYTVLPDASVGTAYAHDLVEDLDFWDPEGDDITAVEVVAEDGAPSWLSISETKEGTWTLSGTPDETATSAYDFRLRVKDSTGGNDRMVHLKVIDPNQIIPVTGLNISSNSMEMYVSNTFQFETEVLPLDASNQALIWMSSDTTIAKVDETGLVSAIDTGIVMITASTLDGNFSDSCEIAVSIEVKEKCEFADIALCGVATQSSIDYGGVASRAIDGNTDGNYSNNSVTHTLAETNPWWEVDLGLEYSIGNINIFNRIGKNNVRLSNFTVRVYNADSVEVFSQTYTTHPDPSVTCNAGGVTGQRVRIELNATNPLSLAEVEVFEYVPVTGILVSPDSFSLTVGETEVLSASVLPSSATNRSLSWSSNDTTIATVDSTGLVTALDTGSVTITVTTLEGGYTSESLFTITDSINTQIAAAEIAAKHLIIYPNPARNTLNYNLQNIKDAESISVYSVLGRRILIQKLENPKGQLDIKSLKSGVYILEIRGKAPVVSRFVKE